jgi:hypothetical protein
LGPEGLEVYPGWRRQKIGGQRVVCAHPDLLLERADYDSKSITLLGYVLDPDQPLAGNSSIIERLLLECDDISEIHRLTHRLGGRWVIIAADGDRVVLFHDAAAQRQVYYSLASESSHQDIICASQPGLIADVLGLAPDPEAISYLNSRGDNDFEVYWMPGDTSQYHGVRALLPNHQLSLEDGRAQRYWPTEALPSFASRDAHRECLRLLQGLMASARNRYPLSIAMTAGWDSRLMLALSKDAAAEDLYCYTLTYPNLSEASRDIVVPAKLLRQLGLRHHVLTYPDVIDEFFKKIFKKSSSSVISPYCADAQRLHEDYPSDRLCVTGDVAEVVKAYYRPRRLNSERVTVRDIATVSKLGEHPFVLAAIDRWLVAAPRTGVNVMDLFCWEQTAGRWHAQIRAEYDIAQESFAPLNCRSLLVTMLGVEEGARTAPDFSFIREMIRASWPEVLNVPINPPEKTQWKWIIVDILHSLRVYQLIPKSLKGLVKRVLQ